MIINYPTGLYADVIATSDNVTWVISNTTPPAVVSEYVQIPVTEQIRSIPSKWFDDNTRRNSMGGMVFSIDEATFANVPSNKKQYGEGDILEFSDIEEITLEVPTDQKIETRHNTNKLDLESLGLAQSDIDKLYQSANQTRKDLDVRFLSIRSEIMNMEFDIQETQKMINEANKAISAVTLIGDEVILTVLQAKLTSLQEHMTIITTQYNQKVTEMEQIKDKINQINQMVK